MYEEKVPMLHEGMLCYCPELLEYCVWNWQVNYDLFVHWRVRWCSTGCMCMPCTCKQSMIGWCSQVCMYTYVSVHVRVLMGESKEEGRCLLLLVSSEVLASGE